MNLQKKKKKTKNKKNNQADNFPGIRIKNK